MARIIDGKLISDNIKTEIATTVKDLLDKGLRAPHLAVVIAGDDGAALSYVSSIEKQCKSVGFIPSVYHLPANIPENEFLATIDFLNSDDEIDGYIIQMPLPKQVSIEKVTAHVSPAKDMDCFHPENMGNLLLGKECYLPATPHGVIELLKRSETETSGKNCVIVGRSNIVGKPMAQLMMQKQWGDATVTVCHSRSKTLKEECREADIIIAAIGQPEFLCADMVKEGAVVIDVGTTRVPDASRKSGFRLTGDVKFDEVAPKCSYITPVPGGVGPMTICSLMKNTLAAGKREYYKL